MRPPEPRTVQNQRDDLAAHVRDLSDKLDRLLATSEVRDAKVDRLVTAWDGATFMLAVVKWLAIVGTPLAAAVYWLALHMNWRAS
jgi:hypothetical protein